MASSVISLNLSGTNNTHNASNGYHNNNSLSSATSASSTSTSSNIYRIGDYVYIESSSSSPYQVCKIEELIKSPNGNVDVKLTCFFRRRDISGSLIKQSALEDDQDKELDQLPELTRHQVKLRELYLTRQVETFPASSIRGKCTVAQLCEAETPSSFLDKDDAFFYTLVYDPSQKSLAPPERGDIRVGSRYQAEVPSKALDDPLSEDTRNLSDLETLVYNSNKVTDQDIDKFITLVKSVGTFARALDCSSAIRHPSVHMSAAAASRDFTLQYAMDTLHQCDYDLLKATFSLVHNNSPVMCRDEMEEWSSAEATLFEEAFDKYEKKFFDIRQNFLPWKTQKNLIEYYYMWKTTDRYVQQKRIKAVENENKLKQVYIPNYIKKENLLNGSSNDQNTGKQCECCKKTSSNNWNPWGPTQFQYFLCQTCWNFWKKFGGFKYPNRIADLNNEKMSSSSVITSITSNVSRPPPIADLNSQYPCRECNKVFNRQERLISHMASHRPHKCNVTSCGKEFKFKAHLVRHCSNSHGAPMRSGSPRPIMKTRAAFHYNVVPSLRLARRISSDVLNLKHAARYPFVPINTVAFKQDYSAKYAKGISAKGVSTLPRLRDLNRGKVVDVSYRLGTPKMPKPEWLVAIPKDQLPQPEKLAFPPTSIEDKNKEIFNFKNVTLNETSRKRSIDQNGNTLPSKRRQMAPPSILGKSVPDLYENISKNAVSTSLNGRAKVATITSVSGQKQMISWVDAPDDVYFVANDKIKQIRRKITMAELRRAARRPWKRCAKGLALLATPNLPTSAGTSASTSHSANSNSLNVAPNIASALNLAGLTQPQAMAAILQQQMLAQNMPLLTNNHFGSSNSFLGMSPNSSGGSTSKLTR